MVWHLTNLKALLIIALQGEFVVGSIVDIEIINQCFILFQIGFDQFVAFDNHFPGGMAPGDFSRSSARRQAISRLQRIKYISVV